MLTEPHHNEGIASDDLNFLMNVPVQTTVELGSCRMTLADILNLGSGSVVQLQRLTNEPVDVLVNGKIVARGDVVAIDGNFGVRVTELLRGST
jgi:flagellar motor switch protein FliN